KLGAKGDIGFFIGYSANSCAYKVYNQRTKKIMETMNVTFDELSAMAFEQRSSKPGLQSMTSGQITMYDDYIGGQPSAAPKNCSSYSSTSSSSDSNGIYNNSRHQQIHPLKLQIFTRSPDISHHSLKMTVPSTTEEKISRRMIQSKKSSSIWLFQNEHQLTLARASKLDSKIGNSWARKSYQRTGRKIIIDGNSTAGYDKSKVECFNCHKMGHFARECRVPRSKDNRSWNQGNSSKTVRIEDASEKAMCAIDGGGFDWSDMAEDEIQANMALMAFSDSETELEKVKEEKEGVEFKLAKFEKSSKDLDDLLASQVTDKSKKGFGYNAVPSPHPLILNRPTPYNLSYSGLEEFQQPEINWYGLDSVQPSTVCNKESNNSKENIDESLILQPKSVTVSSTDVPTLKVDTKWKEKFFNHANNVRLEEPKKASENTDAPIIEDWVSDDEEEAESTPKVEKKIPIATKEASVNNDKPSRRTIRYAELYRSQRPRGTKEVGKSNSQLNEKGFVDSGCSRHSLETSSTYQIQRI
ncbi:putative ribonuclease H-like domain-containing protein, partial [Tanacetum coccineum]